jgi:hypothetical protein
LQEKVFNDATNNVSLIPVHPAAVLESFCTAMINEYDRGTMTSENILLEMT